LVEILKDILGWEKSNDELSVMLNCVFKSKQKDWDNLLKDNDIDFQNLNPFDDEYLLQDGKNSNQKYNKDLENKNKKK
jgi:hypothetical protein